MIRAIIEIFLTAAVAAKVNYIVSGDKDHETGETVSS